MSATTGIGASIIPSGAGGFEITSLSATGNAAAHLQVGDRIMSIGSVVTTGKTDSEVKALILGPAGSTISMVLIPDARSVGCFRSSPQHIFGYISLRCAGSRPRPRQQAGFIQSQRRASSRSRCRRCPDHSRSFGRSPSPPWPHACTR